MDIPIDATLLNCTKLALENIRAGEGQEAMEMLLTRATNFAATLPPHMVDRWTSDLSQKLLAMLPYRDSTNWQPMAPGVALPKDSVPAQRILTIASCFSVLDMRLVALEVTSVFHCITQSTPSEWLACAEQCMAESAWSVAAHCIRHGIATLMATHEHDLAIDDSEQQNLLLTLWFQRARLFELMDRDNDALAALHVFTRYSEVFRRKEDFLQSSDHRSEWIATFRLKSHNTTDAK